MLGILVEFVEFLFIFCILNNHYSRKEHNSLNSIFHQRRSSKNIVGSTKKSRDFSSPYA